MVWNVDPERLFGSDSDATRHTRIADFLEERIASGRARVGERLPTVRQLSKELGVSGTTVVAAYKLLTKRGWIWSEVGRGTFVSNPASAGHDGTKVVGVGAQAQGGDWRPPMLLGAPWRRRALVTASARLRTTYPTAFDCTTGQPDPALLPLQILQSAWKSAVDATVHADLQYSGPEPHAALAAQLLPRFEADCIPARSSDLVIGSSAQQLIGLALHVAANHSGRGELVVAVEEPGYYTIFDTFERMGYRLVGVEVDMHGAIPMSLDAALATGATAVLLTPRAHNPTGASWSVSRAADLAEVVAAHPDVVVIEDDQFAGISVTRPGSLLTDRRIEDRIVYVRSFSKSIAPDLRLAVAVARPRLRTLIAEAKSFADGWSSRLAQRALAYALADPELDKMLTTACNTYAARRIAAAHAVTTVLGPLGGGALSGADGLNIWVHLPPETDAAEVIERAAMLGVLMAPGEPFFLRPGRSDVVRLNAGAVTAEQAADIGRRLGTAALTGASNRSFTMSV